MTTFWAGLTIGGIYAIVAVATNIVFISSRVFNFAQAYFLMIGAFVAYELSTVLGLPLWLNIVICAVVGGAIGGLEEIVAIRRLAGKAVHNELITTLGVGILLAGIAVIIWGNQAQSVSYWINEGAFDLLGGRIAPSDVVITVLAIVIAGGVGLFMRRSIVGLASLATAEDRQAAMLRGVNVRALAFWAFVAGGALVTAVAPVVAARTFATYNLGDSLAVKVFVVLAIGGFGSQRGALVGGFAVGLLEAFAGRYIGSDWANIAVFAVLLVMLLVRPSGIFGRNRERAV